MEKNSSLYAAKKFDKRVNAIDFIELRIIDAIEALTPETAQSNKLILLKNRAEKVKTELEGINIKLFQKLRANISTRNYTGQQFKELVNEHFDFNLHYNGYQDKPYYDNLDIFINGLFSDQAIPEQTKDLESEMVSYHKTPARIVFEIAQSYHFTKEDIFVDLGAGMGQAAILINFLTGIKTRGVEFDPAFCRYAKDCATDLNLSNVTFINADARQADYSEGTVFFMFTPFSGEILKEVLEILSKESARRKITIISYGPGTTVVALESWLYSIMPADSNIYKPRFFSSF